MGAAGDFRFVDTQESSREAHTWQQRKVKEADFLAVMWPRLLDLRSLFASWAVFLRSTS